ncbi:MAG: pantetheine-phosphate adenylyltransferase [Propionibacteriaceae bacterium]
MCPGSFDPITKGHLDVFERAAAIFDEVIVGVGLNTSKKAMFSAQERLDLVQESCAHIPNLKVLPIEGLLIDLCQREGCAAIIKGLRFAVDFEYELPQAQINRQMSGIETIFIPTTAQWGFVSSTLIREIASLGGDIEQYVPAPVARMMADRMGK